MTYDKIIIGAGLYGLYAAIECAKKNQKVLVLEYDPKPFMRATYINQARVHMGYHYPRSYSTAVKSAGYFDRFNSDYKKSIHNKFEKIYAISSDFSWTNATQFKKFCKDSNIPCTTIDSDTYFNKGLCDGAFVTHEYTYDAKILFEILSESISKLPNITIKCNARIDSVKKNNSHYSIKLKNGDEISSDFILNTTYASVNQILNLFKFPMFDIKYELCEIIVCKTNKALDNKGITVMDGPFFSIMPFGKTGMHSLTSVTFTPHLTSKSKLPKFDCQKESKGSCSKKQFGNCNTCIAKPKSAWQYMSNLAKKYLKSNYKFEYDHSLFTIKPILQTSEIDDSRPTLIRTSSEEPRFISVLSGKINTMYDLDEVL